jgi:hypothetical protein
MLKMLDPLIVGLILAALSGITVIAYKHPRGYGRIFSLLVTLASCTAVMLIFWWALEISSTTALIGGLVEKLPTEPLRAISPYVVNQATAWSHIGVCLVIYVATLAYLFLLKRLPRIIES